MLAALSNLLCVGEAPGVAVHMELVPVYCPTDLMLNKSKGLPLLNLNAKFLPCEFCGM